MRTLFRLLPAAALAACATTASTTGAVPTHGPGPRPTLGETELVALARGIHDRVIAIDTHVDIPNNWATPEADPLNRQAQVNLQTMKSGGLDAAFFAVYQGQGPRTPEGNENAKRAAIQKFDAIHRMAEQMYPNLIELAYTPDDVRRIARSGKLVAAIGIENGYVIGNDLSLIANYYDRGSRYMTLAHTSHNDICDSSGPASQGNEEHGGLSAFGRQVVAEMNRVGMMVDVSHVSKKCMMQATAMSRAPVIGSHSGAFTVAPHNRNMDDEQLRALAKNGGVVQAVAFAGYVKFDPKRDSATRALTAEFYPPGQGRAGGAGGGGGGGGGRGGRPPLPPERQAEYDRRMAEINTRWPAQPRATVKDFVDHIDHIVKAVGIDHVGISSDFDGGGGVDGWNNASETFNVTLELVRRGYTEAQIEKMWSGNTLRVWGAAQRVAGKTR